MSNIKWNQQDLEFCNSFQALKVKDEANFNMVKAVLAEISRKEVEEFYEFFRESFQEKK